VSASGHIISALVLGHGVQHWALDSPPRLLGVFPTWPDVQGARLGAQLRYGGRADSLLFADRDRLLLLDPRFQRVVAAVSAPQFSTLQGHQAWPLADQRAALLWRDQRARLLDLTTGAEQGAASRALPWAHEVSAFSPDGAHVLTIAAQLGDAPLDRPGPTTLLGVWDLTRYALAAQLTLPSWVRRLALSPSGDAVALITEAPDPSGAPFSLQLLRLPGLTASDDDAGLPLDAVPELMRWSPDGQHLLLRTPDRTTHALRRVGEDFIEVSKASAQVSALDAAAWLQESALLIWSPARGLYALDLLSERLSAPLLTPQDLGGRLQVYDIATHPASSAVVLTGQGEAVWLALPAATGQRPRWRLLTAGADTPQRFAPLSGADRAVFDAAGRRFALGLGVYDAQTGEQVTTLAPSATPSTRRAFSPDGRWLLDDTGRWDAASGARLDTPSALTPRGQALLTDDLAAAYHPAGAWALSQAAGTVQLQPIDQPSAQSAELAVFGEGAWAVASDQAFNASPQGRALLQLSDGRAALPLPPTSPLEGPSALTAALAQPTWSAPPPPAPAPPPALSYLAHLSITTAPPGARVTLDLGDGSPRALGTTPLVQELPSPTETATLRITLPGYVPQAIPWSPGEDLALSAELREVITDQEAPFIQVEGALTPEDASGMAQRHRIQLRQCAVMAANAGALPPYADARLSVSTAGDVWSVALDALDPTAPLTQCLRHVIMRWRFPARPTGSTVRYRLLLGQYLTAPPL
jgi:hypothetical protein